MKCPNRAESELGTVPCHLEETIIFLDDRQPLNKGASILIRIFF